MWTFSMSSTISIRSLVGIRSCQVFSRAFQSTTTTTSCNFKASVNERKSEARRLVILENLSPRKDINNLLEKYTLDRNYLSEKLSVEVADSWTWFYRRRNFLLLELSNVEDVRRLQEQTGYQSHSFPVVSRMFKAVVDLPETALRARNKQGDTHLHQAMVNTELRSKLNCCELREKVNSNKLPAYLDSNNSLSDLDLRLRYFLLTELEDQLCQGVFGGFHVYPFGSSLAGLGDTTSDLDLVLLHRDLRQSGSLSFANAECIRSERDQTQLALSLLADTLKNFIPNFTSINRILRARVPIVKTSFHLAPVDIDISIELSEENGHHGFIMANYIAYCVSVDPVVRQFFTFVKLWARQHGLVKSIAGNWFSNFQIITLAIFFLQTKGFLKSMETYQIEDKVEEPKKKKKMEKFDQILYDFFEFLVKFNYEKEGISILQGGTITKPDFSPLYLENPIERELNICKNVNGLEFKKLLLVAYNTLDAMHITNDFHLVDLLNPEHFKKLEVAINGAQKQNQK